MSAARVRSDSPLSRLRHRLPEAHPASTVPTRLSLAGVNSHWQMTQDFTDKSLLLSQGVHRLRSGGERPSMTPFIKLVKKAGWNSNPGSAPYGTLSSFLSDGDDNQSDVSRESALEMAQRAEVILYTISTDDGPSVQRGDPSYDNWRMPLGAGPFSRSRTKTFPTPVAAIQDELRQPIHCLLQAAQFDATARYRPSKSAP